MMQRPEQWLTLLAAITLAAPLGASETALSVKLDGVTVHGTLLLPDEGPTHAAVLLIAGSGATDRDGNSLGMPGRNNSLRYVAEALQTHGIASLRYDKRMIGESTAPALRESDLRFEHYARDAAELLAALRDAVPDVPVFLVGHSEGGHLALLAAQDTPVAGVVVLAGPGRHPADLIDAQLAPRLPDALMTEARRALDALRAGRTVDDVPPALAGLFRESVQPYMISWFRHDPAPLAGSLPVPLLLVYGDRDIQVTEPDWQRLASANPAARLVVIEGMNHVLKIVGDDAALQQSSYSDPSLPVAAPLIDALLPFLTGAGEAP